MILQTLSIQHYCQPLIIMAMVMLFSTTSSAQSIPQPPTISPENLVLEDYGLNSIAGTEFGPYGGGTAALRMDQGGNNHVMEFVDDNASGSWGLIKFKRLDSVQDISDYNFLEFWFYSTSDDTERTIQIQLGFENTLNSSSENVWNWSAPVTLSEGHLNWKKATIGLARNYFNRVDTYDDGDVFDLTRLDRIGVLILSGGTTTTSSAVYVDNISLGRSETIAVYGSSVARGVGAAGGLSEGYTARMNGLLGLENWSINNVAVGGFNTTDANDNFNSLVVPTEPSYVYIGLSMGNEGLPGASDPTAVFESFRLGLSDLISLCRSNGYYPILGLVYPHGNYTLAEYEYVKQMNLLLNTWDVPSLNLLGAIDDGTGRWAPGYVTDPAHPNTAGHEEMSYAFVPSLFDAIKEGKSSSPTRVTSGAFARLQQELSEPSPLSYTPSDTIHSFTVSFQVRSNHTGTVAAVRSGTEYASIEIRPESLVYLDQSGTHELAATVDADNGQWYEVTLTHHYARQETMLFVNGAYAGSLIEQIVPEEFILGGSGGAVNRPSAPQIVDLKQWCVYRAGWNADEAEAQYLGNLQQASMEIYAALDDVTFEQNTAVRNRAQSLSKAWVHGSNLTSLEELTDDDSDGIDDAWEVTYFTTIGSIDGSIDSDRDGVKDFFEYLYGSDPTDPTSYGFRLTAQTNVNEGGRIFGWELKEGFSLGTHYNVHVSTDLMEWSLLPEEHFLLNQTTTNGMTATELQITHNYGSSVFVKLVTE